MSRLDVKKKTSKRSTKKIPLPEPIIEEPEPVIETPEDTESETEEVVDNEEDSKKTRKERYNFTIPEDSDEAFTELRDLLNEIIVKIRYINEYRKKLSAQCKRDRKIKKKTRVVDPNKPKKKPTEFQLTKTGCQFFGLPEGSLMSRTEAHTKICTYIKTNDLKKYKEEVNKKGETIRKPTQEILPDKKLAKLLGPAKFPLEKNKDESPMGYSYKNIFSYLGEFFIPKEPATV